MLQRKPHKRLGAYGIEEIKAHEWIRDMDWEKLKNKELVAPFVPGAKDNFDNKQVNSLWPEMNDQVDLGLVDIQKLFAGYEYDTNLICEKNTTLYTEALTRRSFG